MAVEPLTGRRVTHVAEIDPAPTRVLAHHYPTAPNLGDIRSIDWSALVGEVDTITAGFPCQGISSAGTRKGLADERSGIWRDVATAVRVIRPDVVFLENVAALRSRGLPEVLGDLASIGYDCRWSCVRAADVGAPHARDRWFGVAVPATEDPHREPWVERVGAAPGQAPRGRTRPQLGGRGRVPAADADSIRRDGRAGERYPTGGAEPENRRRHSPLAWWGQYGPAVKRWERITGVPAPAATEIGPRGGRRLTAAFAEWMMGLTPGHVTGVEGLTRGQQLKMLGNGVVPQQAYAAYSALLRYQVEYPRVP